MQSVDWQSNSVLLDSHRWLGSAQVDRKATSSTVPQYRGTTPSSARRRHRPIASSLPLARTLLLLQHPSGPQPLIELDAIYNTVMEMAWKMNGPKRWDFLNFLREIILEREKEKPICSFSCMGQPPRASLDSSLSLTWVPLHRLSLSLFTPYLSFSQFPTPLLSLPVIGFLFWRVKRHDLLYLQPQSLEPTPPSPPRRRLNCMRKGGRGEVCGWALNFHRECAVVCFIRYWRKVYSRTNVAVSI